MTEKITMLQAYNNLSAVIEGIRFLPAESNRIQQAMQILASAMQEPAAAAADNNSSAASPDPSAAAQ